MLCLCCRVVYALFICLPYLYTILLLYFNIFLLLLGDKDLARYPFRQNSNFLYLSGANTPSYYLSINTSTTSTTLFVPPPSADYAVWNGHVYTKQQLMDMYDVDDVLYTNETTLFVNRLPRTTTVYTIDSSVALPAPILQLTINKSALPPIMTTCMYLFTLLYLFYLFLFCFLPPSYFFLLLSLL